MSFLDWTIGALAMKIEDCSTLQEDLALDWLGVLSCADKSIRDGCDELSSLFAFGTLKKRQLWCSFVSKGVASSQKSVLMFSPLDKDHLFPEEIMTKMLLALEKKSTNDLLAQSSKRIKPLTVATTTSVSPLQKKPFQGVGGRVSLILEEWSHRGAEPWVTQVLRFGYSIPFKDTPPLSNVPITLPAYSPGLGKFVALTREIDILIRKAVIEEINDRTSPGFYNRLFVVPKSSGGWRPVLDVSALNLFVQKTKFNMETARSVLESLHQGDWMVSLDMQEAYFHILIHQNSWKYLRFVFMDKIYQFRALCFGLSTAPQIFTRVLSPLGNWLHLLGIRVSLYLDDWLLRSSSESQCLKDLKRTLSLTHSLGLLINEEKSRLISSKDILYLGMTLNSRVFRVFLSPKRVQSCLEIVQDCLDRKSCSVNHWTSQLGTLTSVEVCQTRKAAHEAPAIFPESFMVQKDGLGNIPDSRRNQGRLSVVAFKTKTGRRSFPSSALPNPTVLFRRLRRRLGNPVGEERNIGEWSESQRSLHISVRELLAVFLGLQPFSHLVTGQVVAVHGDNSTALSYIRKQGGMRSFTLYNLAIDLLLWAEKYQVTLIPRFVHGKMNVLADGLSRRHQVLPLECTLDAKVCLDLWKLWGKPMIDLFATLKNNRLPLFSSPVPDPLARLVDAMLLDWSGLEAYVFPPFGLITQVLNKVTFHKNFSLTLIAPFWPRKEWFPDLIDLLVDFPRLLPLKKCLLRQPHFERLHQGLSALALTGYRLSGVSSERKVFRNELQKLSRTVDEFLLTDYISLNGECFEDGVDRLKSLLLKLL
ncbi:uncharacterized protein [Palaemon carinicauda]|uniref:uncharacterized protein n=1 Tax=Palaemon carinicauda TaxID=392227 RepID=UPI0035B586E9